MSKVKNKPLTHPANLLNVPETTRRQSSTEDTIQIVFFDIDEANLIANGKFICGSRHQYGTIVLPCTQTAQ